MRLTRSLLALLVVLAGISLSATTIDIGELQLFSNTPSSGNQQLQLFNMTGSNCDATYAVCSNLNITNWSLTVEYNYLGGATQSKTFTAGAADAIGPYDLGVGPYTGQASNPWTFDESCTPGTCPPFDTVITLVTFTGSIGTNDPTVLNNLFGAPGSTFFASPTFTVQYTPQTSQLDLGNNYAFYDPVELLVNSSSGGGAGTVPEPSGLCLLLGGVGAMASFFRRIRTRG